MWAPAGHWRARPPAITVLDTVGAGDASVAALVASRMLWPDKSPALHLGFAVAAGTAACQTAGASPPTREATQLLFDEVEVTQAAG